MASAATKLEEPIEEAPEGVIEGGEESQQQERDYEAEARERGWSPEDEFKGDKARWVDAKTFVDRTDTMMPLLKADRDRIKRELADFKKDLKRATKHFDAAEQRGFERAKAELEARIESAVETGDLDAAKVALKEIGELKPAVAAEPGHKYTKEEAFEALDAFREEHPWFDRGNLGGATEVEINGRAMMDRIVDKRLSEVKPGEEPPPAEFFAACAAEVFAKYPALTGKPSRVRPNSAVEAPGAGRGGRATAETFENLPPEAQRLCDRFVARGIIKDRAAYVKTYDWSKP